jgi:tetratricopeptide (TPR) repeat protein
MRNSFFTPFVLISSFFVFFFLITPLGIFSDWIPPALHTGHYSLTVIDSGDDAGYYAFLRSLFFDGDIDFYNERFYSHADHYTATGYVFNNWQIGQGILFFPFYLVGHLWALILNFLDYPVSLDGYSFPYYMSTAIASQTYLFLGLLTAVQINRKFFEERIAVMAVGLIWMTSPLLYYTFIRQRMAHTAEFFLVALLILNWLRLRKSRSFIDHAILGALLGFLSMIRIINISFLVLYFFDQVILLKDYSKSDGRFILKNFLNHSVCMVLSFLIVLSPQLFIWQKLNGIFLPIRQFEMASEGMSFILSMDLPQKLWNVFLGSQWGLLFFFPIFIISIIGLFYEKKLAGIKPAIFAYFVAIFFIIIIYPGKSDAYGERHLISSIPFLILGLSACLSEILKKKAFHWAVILCAFLFVVYHYLILIQYKIVFPYDDSQFTLKAISNIPDILFRRVDLMLRSSNFFSVFYLGADFDWTYKEFAYFIFFPLFQLVSIVTIYYFFIKIKAWFGRESIKRKRFLFALGALLILFFNLSLLILNPNKTVAEIESKKSYMEIKKEIIKTKKEGGINEINVKLERAVQLVPNSWIANFNLALNLDASLKIKEANKYYEKVLRLNPNHFSSKFNMAKNYVSLGRLDEAESLFRLAVSDNPINPKAYMNLAQLEVKKNRFKEAGRLFKQAIDLKPDFGIAHLNYAIFLTNLKQFQKAIYHMKIAFDLGVKDALLGKLMNYYGVPSPVR